MITYEQGKDYLCKIIKENDFTLDKIKKRDYNEAETRFHLIDEILLNVLGWQRNEISVEKNEDNTFADYQIGNPPLLLIEAKREGYYFEIPDGYDKEKSRINTLCTISDEIKSAIDQALNYCHNRGIQFGVVTNGIQYIGFIASRQDGVPPRQGSALIFKSLNDIESRFKQFWNSFSPLGVKKDNLAIILSANIITPPPDKLSSFIVDYPGYRNRNKIAQELKILGGLFLEDISRTEEIEERFLQETHCKSGALSQYALVSKEILKLRYSTVFEKDSNVSAAPAVTKKGLAPEIKDDIFAAALSKRPILLVGDVGVGKSMFIKHFIKIDAKEELERALVFYIDFGSKPALLDNLNEYVVNEITNQLLEKYEIDIHENNFVKGVYHKELIRFNESFYKEIKEKDKDLFYRKKIEYLENLINNVEGHLKACFEHARKAQQRDIVIFLDNVDQRPSQFQEKVFLIQKLFPKIGQ